VVYSHAGKMIRESAKTKDERAARKFLIKRLGEIGVGRFTGPAIERVTVSELLDDLLTDYELNGKTLWWAKLNVENHLRPFFKYQRAVRVGTQQLQEYVIQKRAEKLSDSTINRHLALLRRSFKLGMKREPPKVLRVPTFQKLDESAGVRRGFFEHGNFQKLRAELPDDIRPVAIFAYFTGCRKGEILGLQWRQVDLDQGMVRLNRGETKNKEPRTIPLPSEVLKSLRALKTERDANWPWSPWVFSRHGTQIKGIYGAWRSASKRAGVDGSLLHDMRRTGVRNLIRAGVPDKVAMQISGHKTRDVFDRYDITVEADLRDAAALLDKHMRSKVKN